MGIRAAFGLLTLCMALAVYLGVGSGADANRVYAMPVSEVNHLIDEIDLPEIIFANHKVRHWRENDKLSVWALQNDAGKETFRLTATTATDKKGSLVTVAVLPPNNDKRDEVKKMLDDNPAFADLYGSALAEQIDAKLRNRLFSIANISRPMARVSLRAAPQILQMRKSIDEEYARKAQDDRERYDRLYKSQ
ncbi:hypothetical protein [Bradyrhizobium acaciae]|uniref:hypothetical protein n=1 Tax=Bradyrhizobium acaciae TaxID=2683706 RepID=UPI001E4D6DF2|nr:hypothetical protein [Bradyrhizobium acaciae]MCC8982996.1 hypothetical protein [Bradyrhizobium acaciae]